MVVVVPRRAREPAQPRPFRALGRRIAALRHVVDISQREAADIAGISEGYWPNIESGLVRPQPEVLRRMALAVRGDYDELAGLAGYRDIETGTVTLQVDAENAAILRWFRRLPRPVQEQLRAMARIAFPDVAENPTDGDAERQGDGDAGDDGAHEQRG